ncbi:hypothetical protein GCM10011399_20910 [Subtercola lobariae]|uniref:Alpha/beta hydrolase n=2 Tax=Subtercola lobariae TaxID=1588641 RepID=A0A917EXM5_9MICO|nr:hypothetical protein GCM10011399_20910 [Subtercola lobariae]
MLDYASTVTDELCSALERRTAEPFADASAYRVRENVLRPVLLLPGVFETWQALRHVGDEAVRLGHPVHIVPSLGRNVAPIDESAAVLARYLDDHDLSSVILVAHSKGGLVGKYLMTRFDDAGRVDGMIAINTPFSGSQWGDYLPIRSVRALAHDDLIVRYLGASAAVDDRIVSVYSTFDQNVRAGSRLAGARNVRLNVAGHARILRSKKLLRLLPEAFSWLPQRPR